MRHAVSRELYAYWRALRRGGCPPERNEVEPGAIRCLLPDTFVLEFDAESGYPFRICGSRIERSVPEGTARRRLPEDLAGRRPDPDQRDFAGRRRPRGALSPAGGGVSRGTGARRDRGHPAPAASPGRDARPHAGFAQRVRRLRLARPDRLRSDDAEGLERPGTRRDRRAPRALSLSALRERAQTYALSEAPEAPTPRRTAVRPQSANRGPALRRRRRCASVRRRSAASSPRNAPPTREAPPPPRRRASGSPSPARRRSANGREIPCLR